jgi:hypothetical protein
MKIGAQIKKPNKLASQTKIDNVKSLTIKSNADKSDNFNLLQKCWNDYLQLDDLRKRYKRNRDYLFGKQWNDIIWDPTARQFMTEETYITNQGRVPLKQNYCSNLMRNIVGQYRRNPSQSIVNARAKEAAMQAEMMSNALQAELTANQAIELDSQAVKVFALSGAPCQKVRWTYLPERAKYGLLLSNININRLFWNTDVSDLRLNDLVRIGEIHDMYLNDLNTTFAKTPEDQKRFEEIYTTAVNTKEYWTAQSQMDPSQYDNMNFYISNQINKCRVYEVWTRESEWRITDVWDFYEPNPQDYSKTWDLSYEKVILAENKQRKEQGLKAGIPESEIEYITYEKKMHSYWYYRFLSPWGDILSEGETPYAHNEHPYILSLFPLIDGEVRGWFEDVIDLQRQMNRMLILMDMTISNSAKGVWMIPEGSWPDNMTPDEYVDTITKAGGVVFYKYKAGVPAPQYMVSQSSQAGTADMLRIVMQLIDDISGLHGAIQGKSATSGTPASLYEQEAANSAISTVEFMQVFGNFKQKRDLKIIKLIKQYYTTDRYIATAGKAFSNEAKMYKSEEVNQFDYDNVISHAIDSPVYRQIAESSLNQWVAQGFLPFKQFLEVSDLPYAQKILDQINKAEENASKGGNSQIPPDMAKAAQEGNPQAQAAMQQILSSQQSQQTLAQGQGAPTEQQKEMPLIPSGQ